MSINLTGTGIGATVSDIFVVTYSHYPNILFMWSKIAVNSKSRTSHVLKDL